MKTNDKNKYKDFGDRLSLIMYKQNISNIQLANAMFVSPSTISGYRTGRRSPTVADLAAIVQILNVSADYLIGTSEITTRPDTTEKKELSTPCFQSGAQLFFINHVLPVKLP